MKAIRVHTFGGPEVLKYEEVPVPEPKPGEAVIKVDAAGVNFIDIYQRSGVYKPPLPMTLGQEGGGTVSAIGAGTADVKVGDRVAWAGALGSYAEYAAVPVAKLAPLPSAVSTRQGAAIMLQGITAHYLACSTYPLKPGDTCLVHAGAGGVGLLLTQIAKLRGARVISTVSTAEKADLSRAAGADHVIQYTSTDFEQAVKDLTGGVGVDVVYDSVGVDTFAKGLNVIKRRGLMALYGQSSGVVPPLDPQVLMQKKSLFLTRPGLGDHMADRTELMQRTTDLFGWIAGGRLKVRMEFEFALKDAADAHAALAGRKTTGKVLLIP